MKLKGIARIRMCFKYSEAFQLELEGQKHTERDPFTIPSFLLQSSPNSKVDSETGHAAWGATVIQKRESLRARSLVRMDSSSSKHINIEHFLDFNSV